MKTICLQKFSEDSAASGTGSSVSNICGTVLRSTFNKNYALFGWNGIISGYSDYINITNCIT